MNCFMFPGQPLSRGQLPGGDPDFLAISELVREKARYDLQGNRWLGEEMGENVALQLYGAAMGLYSSRLLRREGVRPVIIAEHSMGIYPALAASGALSEGDAIEMAFRVGACMARMAPAGTYALGCMVGLTIEPLLAIAENNGVYVANLNTSRHFLLSGPRRNIEEAEAEALQAGAFSVRTFPSDAPLHTPLLAGLEGGLREIFAGYRYREPEVPLLDHIDQEYLTAGDLAEFLVRELTLPVYWEKSYRALRRAGVSSFYEAGAGDALKKYNRWIDSE